MATPRRPRGNRALLWVWVVFSLVSLAYSLLLFAQSAPVTRADADAMAHGDEEPMRTSERLVLADVAEPRNVVTVAHDMPGQSAYDARGDILYFTAVNGTDPAARRIVPFQLPAGSVGRALAYVERNATTGAWDLPTLNVTNVTELELLEVPRTDPSTGEFEKVNLTLDLTSLKGDAGFVVKGDAAAAPFATLVPMENVVGKVVRDVPALSIWTSLGLSTLGTVIPLLLIITTHRGRGVAGVPGAGGATGPACPECGRPAVEGTEFCVRCGALLKAR